MAHLRMGGYPDRVMAGIARALAVKPAARHWSELRDLYVRAEGREEKDGLAVALAAAATPAHTEEMIALLDIESLGDTRIYFLRALKKHGGQRGRDLVDSLRSDPTFGREARALSR